MEVQYPYIAQYESNMVIQSIFHWLHIFAVKPNKEKTFTARRKEIFTPPAGAQHGLGVRSKSIMMATTKEAKVKSLLILLAAKTVVSSPLRTLLP